MFVGWEVAHYFSQMIETTYNRLHTSQSQWVPSITTDHREWLLNKLYLRLITPNKIVLYSVLWYILIVLGLSSLTSVIVSA